jgi:hypothetical protein
VLASVFGTFQLAAGEGTAGIDDSLVSVNIAFLEGDPFGGP